MPRAKTGQGAAKQRAPQATAAKHEVNAHAAKAFKVPALTEQLAGTMALMLHAGCPPFRAVLYCVPGLDNDRAKELQREWMRSSLLLKAVERLNGGDWMTLPVQQRMQLAYDKNLSEMAFYLYANNFNDIEHREGLEKMKVARETLKTELKGVSDDDPMAAFARFAKELLTLRSEKQAENPAGLDPEDSVLERMVPSTTRKM